jgi:hypothetical protein
MRGVRGRGWAAAAMVFVVVAVSGSAPVSADVVAPGAPSDLPSALSGDFNGDGRPDIALAGASGWNGVSTALRTASGGFTVGYTPVPAFAAWASLPGVKLVTGRFDSDSDDDIVLTGVAGWTTLRLARSNGNGTFTISNAAAGSFPTWAGVPGARVLSGDFNGDGRTDLALAGGDTWSTIPVAMANANGTFTVTNNPAPAFAGNAQHFAARVFAEDLNADGRTDLVLVPGGDALLTDLSLTVAYSTGFGSFSESSISLPDFVGATNGKAVTVGDFNNDNRTDLAVVLDTMILVAYSLGTGSFAVYRAGATVQFYLRANRPGARIVGTDNDCDGRTDLVVISEPNGGWTTMPVAMPRGEEEFFVMDDPLPNFPQWSGVAGAQLLIDDYDGDGCEDLALTGGAGWSSVPIAMSNGDGSYHEQNIASPNFAAWAAGTSPVTLPPPPAETLGALSLLDTTVWSGITPSMAIGTDGLGIISYYVSNPELMNLRVAHCEDAACSAITTTDIDTMGDVGRWSSIKIGSDGLPLISYVHERNINPTAFTQDLKVAHCNDIACTSATVTPLDKASRVSDVTSLAIGGDGFGLVSYQDTASSTSTKMKVAHCLDIACTSAHLATIDTVKPDNGETGGYSQTGIAVGNHGLGLISYYDGGTNQMLKVAACTNADCSTTVRTIVDKAPSGSNLLHGGWSSVAFGLDGLALISYNANYSSTDGSDLNVAHCLNVYCSASTKITADTGGHVGWHTSTTIGGDGLGAISYYDITNRDLKLAHCTNLTCSSATATTVDSFDDVGSRSSVTVGADGLPLISYIGPGPLGVILRVVRCGNSDCTAVIVAPF